MFNQAQQQDEADLERVGGHAQPKKKARKAKQPVLTHLLTWEHFEITEDIGAVSHTFSFRKPSLVPNEALQMDARCRVGLCKEAFDWRSDEGARASHLLAKGAPRHAATNRRNKASFAMS